MQKGNYFKGVFLVIFAAAIIIPVWWLALSGGDKNSTGSPITSPAGGYGKPTPGYDIPTSYGNPIEQGSNKAVLLKALADNPLDPELNERLGDLYFERRDYRQAIGQYEKAINLDPTLADAYNDLGLAYHYSGEPDSAIDALIKGTEAAPEYQRVWLSLGYVLAANNRADEAREALQKAIDLDPFTDVGAEAARIQMGLTGLR